MLDGKMQHVVAYVFRRCTAIAPPAGENKSHLITLVLAALGVEKWRTL